MHAMAMPPTQPARRPPRLPALVIALLTIAPAAAQSASPEPAALAGQQRAVHERYGRFEERIAALIQSLRDTAPDQAERLAATLDRSGRAGVRQELAALATLLGAGRLDSADARQRQTLTTLQELLALLTAADAPEQHWRATLEQLRAWRAAVAALRDAQLAAADALAATPPTDAADFAAAAAAQQTLSSQTNALRADMAASPDAPAAGQRPLEQAAPHMDTAAAELAKQDASAGEREQRAAAAALSAALAELDSALSEAAQAARANRLAELLAHLRDLLARQRAITAAARPLAARPAADWTTDDELRLAVLAAEQGGTADATDAVRGLLSDEDAVVVLPELLAQVAADQRDAAQRLTARDLTPPTLALLDDIVAQLVDLLGVLEAQQQPQRPPPDQLPPDAPTEPGESGEPPTPPLVPGSAELRLLRSAQARLNTAAAQLDTLPPDAPQRARLVTRQRELADLTRQMLER
jgi:hypothetical protein